MAAIDPNNLWRQDTPGSDWPRSPRPTAANKYFMVSADCHVQEPNDFLAARMDKKFQERLPGIVLGGLAGSWALHRINEKLLRVLVVCIGITLTIGLFLRG